MPGVVNLNEEVHMLRTVNIFGIFVLDQDQALDFYVGKLGLEVSNDMDMGFMRWLTVRVPGQPGPDILLEIPSPPGMDADSAKRMRDLVTKGATGFCAGFTTDDCRKTYETLVSKGVEITQEPTEQFYGTDMGIRDPFGNHIRIVQLAPRPQEAPTPA
jgi:predicted enzyme related to lactoylglutathione lyase